MIGFTAFPTLLRRESAASDLDMPFNARYSWILGLPPGPPPLSSLYDVAGAGQPPLPLTGIFGDSLPAPSLHGSYPCRTNFLICSQQFLRDDYDAPLALMLFLGDADNEYTAQGVGCGARVWRVLHKYFDAPCSSSRLATLDNQHLHSSSSTLATVWIGSSERHNGRLCQRAQWRRWSLARRQVAERGIPPFHASTSVSCTRCRE